MATPFADQGGGGVVALAPGGVALGDDRLHGQRAGLLEAEGVLGLGGQGAVANPRAGRDAVVGCDDLVAELVRVQLGAGARRDRGDALSVRLVERVQMVGAVLLPASEGKERDQSDKAADGEGIHVVTPFFRSWDR
ncbi:MAG: hypothetical protein JWP35_3522 [Caulobacter sp.]|nr:hypothetical protein [Caulobacter sp.]